MSMTYSYINMSLHFFEIVVVLYVFTISILIYIYTEYIYIYTIYIYVCVWTCGYYRQGAQLPEMCFACLGGWMSRGVQDEAGGFPAGGFPVAPGDMLI